MRSLLGAVEAQSSQPHGQAPRQCKAAWEKLNRPSAFVCCCAGCVAVLQSSAAVEHIAN